MTTQVKAKMPMRQAEYQYVDDGRCELRCWTLVPSARACPLLPPCQRAASRTSSKAFNQSTFFLYSTNLIARCQFSLVAVNNNGATKHKRATTPRARTSSQLWRCHNWVPISSDIHQWWHGSVPDRSSRGPNQDWPLPRVPKAKGHNKEA
jgi:hypothetical protein